MNIKIDLGDKNSINRAIKQIKDYQKSIKGRVEIFLERVGKLGIDIANTYIGAYSIPSEVIGQIVLQKGDIVVSGGTIQIIITNDEALFWEYGTGLIGKANPHIDTNGWGYAVNPKRSQKSYEKGWIFDGNGTQWSWDFKDTGLQFTKGMPSQPFMYLTYNSLLNNQWSQIVSIAKEVFSE